MAGEPLGTQVFGQRQRATAQKAAVLTGSKFHLILAKHCSALYRPERFFDPRRGSWMQRLLLRMSLQALNAVLSAESDVSPRDSEVAFYACDPKRDRLSTGNSRHPVFRVRRTADNVVVRYVTPSRVWATACWPGGGQRLQAVRNLECEP